MIEKKASKTLVERVAAHKARLLAAGGKKLGISLQPASVQAAEKLVAAGYGPSTTAVINRALVELAEGLGNTNVSHDATRWKSQE